MNYKDITRTVSGRTGLTRARADEVIVATLTVLSEAVSPEETRDLLAQLPKSLQERVPVSSTVIEMRPIEFVARIADLVEGVPVDDADSYAHAVFATLNEAVNAGEMRDIADELGPDFADLLGRPVRARVAAPGPGEDAPGVVEVIGGTALTFLTLPLRGLALLHRILTQRRERSSSYSRG